MLFSAQFLIKPKKGTHRTYQALSKTLIKNTYFYRVKFTLKSVTKNYQIALKLKKNALKNFLPVRKKVHILLFRFYHTYSNLIE